jgi:cytochrome c oxidase subunit 3
MNQTLTIKDPFGTATTGKLGMWLFLIMDALTFATILLGGIYLRLRTDLWPDAGIVLNIPLTSLNTFLLIMSSFTMVMAMNAIKHNNQKGLKTFLFLTIMGGVTFLGIQVYEYSHFIMGSPEMGAALTSVGLSGNSFLWTTGAYGSAFYATTAFHGLHVLSGVIYLTVILVKANNGAFSSSNFDHVEIAGLFWHFVDLVWILVFTIIYLI